MAADLSRFKVQEAGSARVMLRIRANIGFFPDPPLLAMHTRQAACCLQVKREFPRILVPSVLRTCPVPACWSLSLSHHLFSGCTPSVKH